MFSKNQLAHSQSINRFHLAPRVQGIPRQGPQSGEDGVRGGAVQQVQRPGRTRGKVGSGIEEEYCKERHVHTVDYYSKEIRLSLWIKDISLFLRPQDAAEINFDILLFHSNARALPISSHIFSFPTHFVAKRTHSVDKISIAHTVASCYIVIQ